MQAKKNRETQERAVRLGNQINQLPAMLGLANLDEVALVAVFGGLAVVGAFGKLLGIVAIIIVHLVLHLHIDGCEQLGYDLGTTIFGCDVGWHGGRRQLPFELFVPHHEVHHLVW